MAAATEETPLTGPRHGGYAVCGCGWRVTSRDVAVRLGIAAAFVGLIAKEVTQCILPVALSEIAAFVDGARHTRTPHARVGALIRATPPEPHRLSRPLAPSTRVRQPSG
jgi:hypothetical protein